MAALRTAQRWRLLAAAWLATLVCMPAWPAVPATEYPGEGGLSIQLRAVRRVAAGSFATPAAPFVIGILGDDPFGDVIDNVVRGESLAGHPLEVRRYRDPENIGDCNILFISAAKRRAATHAAALRGRHILTVTDFTGDESRAAIIVLLTENNRIRMRINVAEARANDLVISSKLLRPAEVIGMDGADHGRAGHTTRRKLSAIALISTGCRAAGDHVMFLAGEVVAIRQGSLRELRILSEAIASNSTAALAFENPEDARGRLGAFRADPHIVAAALYKADGQLFVSYTRPSTAPRVPPSPPSSRYAFEGSALIGVTPVRENERVLGTLYVRSDMSAIYDRLMSYALVAAAVIALALLAAWIIALRLQRQLSVPILELAANAKKVSDAHDYRVRATPVGIHELDDLTHAFNHMLEQTEQFERRTHAQLSRSRCCSRSRTASARAPRLTSIFSGVCLRSLEEHLPSRFGCVCLHGAHEDKITVRELGAASASCAIAGLRACGAEVAIGQQRHYRALSGTLIYEPDTSEVRYSMSPQRFTQPDC
jgi:hypothetical protein